MDSAFEDLTEPEASQRFDSVQYFVTQQKGTEMAYTGKYLKHFAPGTYVCVVCSQPLFSSEAKYEAGNGWPAFKFPINQKCLKEDIDTTHYIVRTEIMCSKCGSHLGHVFEDEPEDGLRYTVNSASLNFVGVDDKIDANTLQNLLERELMSVCASRDVFEIKNSQLDALSL